MVCHKYFKSFTSCIVTIVYYTYYKENVVSENKDPKWVSDMVTPQFGLTKWQTDPILRFNAIQPREKMQSGIFTQVGKGQPTASNHPRPLHSHLYPLALARAFPRSLIVGLVQNTAWLCYLICTNIVVLSFWICHLLSTLRLFASSLSGQFRAFNARVGRTWEQVRRLNPKEGESRANS